MVRPGSTLEHIAKAIGFADAARVLLRNGMGERAVSDAYYSAHHTAQALLATIGLGSETHGGVHSMLSRHFVKHGPLPPHSARTLNALHADRLLADYDVHAPVAQNTVAEAIGNAALLITEMTTAIAATDTGAAEEADRLRVASQAFVAELPATPPPAGR